MTKSKSKEEIDAFVAKVEKALRSSYAARDTQLTVSRPAAIAGIVDALKWAGGEKSHLELFFPELAGDNVEIPHDTAPKEPKLKVQAPVVNEARSPELLLEISAMLKTVAIGYKFDEMMAKDEKEKSLALSLGESAYLVSNALEWAAGKDNSFDKFHKDMALRKGPAAENQTASAPA